MDRRVIARAASDDGPHLSVVTIPGWFAAPSPPTDRFCPTLSIDFLCREVVYDAHRHKPPMDGEASSFQFDAI